MNMITVYEEHIKTLEKENKSLKAQDDVLDSGTKEEYNEEKVPKKTFAEFKF